MRWGVALARRRVAGQGWAGAVVAVAVVGACVLLGAIAGAQASSRASRSPRRFAMVASCASACVQVSYSGTGTWDYEASSSFGSSSSVSGTQTKGALAGDFGELSREVGMRWEC